MPELNTCVAKLQGTTTISVCTAINSLCGWLKLEWQLAIRDRLGSFFEVGQNLLLLDTADQTICAFLRYQQLGL